MCCFAKGCVCCAYKLIVEPTTTKRSCSDSELDPAQYYPNKRPEQCLRETLCVNSNESIYTSLGEARLLTVGDGDLSFSLALANQLSGTPALLVATTHLSRSALDEAYGSAMMKERIETLATLGVKVIHNVDATTLHTNTQVFQDKVGYDRIIWNFPCVAGLSSRAADAQLQEIDTNQALLADFFTSTCTPGLLTTNGEVHVSHKAKPPFLHWDIKNCATKGAQSGLSFVGSVVFDRTCFPGYNTKKVSTGAG